MFILASSSPRRKLLLKKLISDFIVISPKVDERALDALYGPSTLSKEESLLKAYAVFKAHPNDEILSADTIVVLKNKVLGKPKDKEDAVRMLLEESGKRQAVLTSYTYLGKGKEITRTVRSYVYFNPLTEKEIRTYVDRFLPLDKAGSYGIQDPFPLVSHIEGSYDNIVGLPTEDIAKHVFRN
ncbi:MAG TPA: septum formation protein Maf [Firmicutes bacterium]|nr:septum formation protein Maf [Bacillota bacterium]